MVEKEKILFITTSSLAANPRLIKELNCLSQDYECHVLSYFHDDWALAASKEFQDKNSQIKFVNIDRTQKNIWRYLSRIIHKLSILINSKFNFKFIIPFASNDKTTEMLFATFYKVKKGHFARVVAHNLGSFYPAVLFCKKNNIPLQLDIEDYHAGERTYFNHNKEPKNRLFIMQLAMNKASFISYASNGIYLKCKEVFHFRSTTKHQVIINSFPQEDFNVDSHFNKDAINCVWYSQKISHGRGLEQIFEIADKMGKMNFHFIGFKNEEYLSKFSFGKNVFFYPSVKQIDLHHFLCKMDIGLALENKNIDQNRDICLTNKILSYAQAGLYILATDTFGQRDFLNNLNYKAGKIIEKDLYSELQNIDVNELQQKQTRRDLAKEFSWEQESKKLLQFMFD